MKKYQLISFIFVLLGSFSKACEACKLQQPKITQELTHGKGPQSNWDWAIVVIISVITLATLFYAVKFLMHPGEKNKSHIKNNVLSY
ncbi:hypothetical protein G6R40_03900 [Chryseobacterium sp. POL2]|uniref:hypothetical protein n=1 Tax=Chryseobacterium sp. POL2 TaxID=2713414 RepID=UPI0013E0F5EE|nr:hypothetical protein [Chryseobacterium sp. POL2]QIG88865.1 hypothetical protein G6R40_03900 [Chryseobacterium sp. POL2]